MYSLGICIVELWRPFDTGMERCLTIEVMGEAAMPHHRDNGGMERASPSREWGHGAGLTIEACGCPCDSPSRPVGAPATAAEMGTIVGMGIGLKRCLAQDVSQTPYLYHPHVLQVAHCHWHALQMPMLLSLLHVLGATQDSGRHMCNGPCICFSAAPCC